MEIEHERIKEINEKIGKVLQKLIILKFELKNEVYLNLLFSNIFGKNDSNKYVFASNKELKEELTKFVIDTINLWEKQTIIPRPQILSFVLNLTGEISREDKIFVNLNSQNVYESFVSVTEEHRRTNASVNFGFINLLCNFLEHKCGVQWILCTNHWIEVVNLGAQNSTIYINRKVTEFVVRLLEKTITFHRNFCINLINLLIKPFKEFLELFKTIDSIDHPQNQQASFNALKPHFVFLAEITEFTLKNPNNNICDLFIELETLNLIRQLLPYSQCGEMSFVIIKNILNLLFFALRKKTSPGNKQVIVSQEHGLMEDVKLFIDIIYGEIEKEHSRCILKLCNHWHLLWSYTASPSVGFECRGEVIEFQYQMILIHLMPIMLSSLFFLGEDVRAAEEIFLNDDYRRQYVHKWIKISAIETVKMCFKWRDAFSKKDYLLDDVIFALQLIVKSQKFLDKEKATLFFQPLVYTLHDSLIYLEYDCLGSISPRLIKFMDSLIEAILHLVKIFDITWKDSIETISVLKLTCEYLQIPYLVDKLIVKGLKLLDMAISKHMSPDMVLLMDNQKDSVVTQTGSLLYVKCHNGSWEIRDTALEVVCTLSANANTRFPAFKNILLDAKLPNLVVEMALNDGEFYVRASALKCLQELIQVNDIWELLQSSSNFYDDILNIFDKETEGIVRKEAAILIYTIHKHQDFPKEILVKLYNIMCRAAVDDLYWEVKLNALKFWIRTVEKLLTDQGMIDRGFPTVTFSSEQKKIITLNDVEIRKRIIKVLYQLNETGGLYVLKMAVEDDLHLEVTKFVVAFSEKFVHLFKKYKLDVESVDSISTQMAELNNLPGSSSTKPDSDIFDQTNYESNYKAAMMDIDPIESVTKNQSKFDSLEAEQILDELLNSNDLTLLRDTYNPNMNKNNAFAETSTSFDMINRKYLISPSEYVKFIYDKFGENNHIIKEKTAWAQQLDDFNSLLDDILQDCDTNLLNINNMDCY